MVHTVEPGNWSVHLMQLIRQAQDGDTIQVISGYHCELAENARKKMCPKKRLTFTVRPRQDKP